MTNKDAYAQSGVDVSKGVSSWRQIKKHVAHTGDVQGYGSFGGSFSVCLTFLKTGVQRACLISGTDLVLVPSWC